MVRLHIIKRYYKEIINENQKYIFFGRNGCLERFSWMFAGRVNNGFDSIEYSPKFAEFFIIC